MEYTTDKVKVYDVKGNVISETALSEKIMAIPAKRTGISESGLYYKGAGIVYQKHMACEISQDTKLISGTVLSEIFRKYY